MSWSTEQIVYAAVGGAGIAYSIGRIYVMKRWSSSWAKVQATVEDATTSAVNTGDGVEYSAVVSYSYQYEGEFYGGACNFPDGSSAAADRQIAKYPKGTAITVRCNPRHPDRSMLIEDDNSQVQPIP